MPKKILFPIMIAVMIISAGLTQDQPQKVDKTLYDKAINTIGLLTFENTLIREDAQMLVVQNKKLGELYTGLIRELNEIDDLSDEVKEVLEKYKVK